MATVGRVLAIGAVVLAIPAACIGALALYGRALAESEVAVGTLVSPAEARARLERERARFRAMTPAQHLEEARRALTMGYDEATHTGGNFGGVEHHAAAIPDGAPEHAELAALRDEVRRRRVNLFALARGRVAQHLGEHATVADAVRQRTMRAELARDVDELAPPGPRVRPRRRRGPHHAALRPRGLRPVDARRHREARPHGGAARVRVSAGALRQRARAHRALNASHEYAMSSQGTPR